MQYFFNAQLEALPLLLMTESIWTAVLSAEIKSELHAATALLPKA